MRIARKLSAVARQPHTTISIGSDFLEAFPALAERAVYLSDGNMDVSGAVELYANAQARKIAPVRLTGNYGSEILRSNVAFRPGRLDRGIFTPEFDRLLDQAAQTYYEESAGHRLSFIAFKQVPWHHHSRLSVEQSQITPRSPFLDNELVALAYRAPATVAQDPGPLLELIAAGNPQLEQVPTDRRLSRRSSWTGRLGRAWQEFTAKAEYAYDYGMPPRLARIDRRVSWLHLERVFLGRHKFYHFRTWYKNQLSGYLRAVAGDGPSARAVYRSGAPRKLIEAHMRGAENRTLELNKLLSVDLIERLFLGNKWAT
jgi:asparagine synthase (glutamine-hydrolysing)